jgi:RNA polymerase sigma factor (sigma-70 family)
VRAAADEPLVRHALSTVMLRARSDQALVALARDGDESAFTVLVERYSGSLLALARRVGDASRAEDAVQQGLLQAWAALRGGAEVRDTRPWLHQIVRHATYAPAMRARPEEELPEALTGSPEPHATLERRMHLRSVTAAIQGLPDNQRNALLQTAIEGRSNREVAHDLGVSESAVRQLVHRARARVRQAAAAIAPLPGLSWIARRHASAAMPDVHGDALPAAAAATGGGIIVKAAVAALAAGALATGGLQAHRVLNRPHHPTAASPAKTLAATDGRPAAPRTQPASSLERARAARAAAELRRARPSPGTTSHSTATGPAITDQGGAQAGGAAGSDTAAPVTTATSDPTSNAAPPSAGGTDAPPASTGGGAGGAAPAQSHASTGADPPAADASPATADPPPDAADPTVADATAPAPDGAADTTDTP